MFRPPPANYVAVVERYPSTVPCRTKWKRSTNPLEKKKRAGRHSPARVDQHGDRDHSPPARNFKLFRPGARPPPLPPFFWSGSWTVSTWDFLGRRRIRGGEKTRRGSNCRDSHQHQVIADDFPGHDFPGHDEPSRVMSIKRCSSFRVREVLGRLLGMLGPGLSFIHSFNEMDLQPRGTTRRDLIRLDARALQNSTISWPRCDMTSIRATVAS